MRGISRSRVARLIPHACFRTRAAKRRSRRQQQVEINGIAPFIRGRSSMPRAACSSSRSDENGGTSLAESSARKGPSPDSWYRSAPILVRRTRRRGSLTRAALGRYGLCVRSFVSLRLKKHAPPSVGARVGEHAEQGLARFEVLSSFPRLKIGIEAGQRVNCKPGRGELERYGLSVSRWAEMQSPHMRRLTRPVK